MDAAILPHMQRGKTVFSKNEVMSAIQRTLSVLTHPEQVVELRILGLNKRIDSGYFSDPDKLTQAAARYDGRAEGVYVTLNPVLPALLARSNNRVREYARTTTSDADIIERRWLFIDFDPVRPSGISASAHEHDVALERASACREWLFAKRITSLLADSGNGAHLLIPVCLQNDADTLALTKSVLKTVEARFSDMVVKVDTSTASAGHLIKLHGTLACKGDDMPDRPHRRSGLLHVPESVAPVSVELLTALTSEITSTDSRSNPAVNPPEPQPVTQQDGDRTHIDEIKQRFDMVAFTEQTLGVTAMREGTAYRLPGHQGFLISPDKGCWYHHGGTFGGDALDLVGYLRFGAGWDKRHAPTFQAVLAEAAQWAGVTLPPSRYQAQQPSTTTTSVNTTLQTLLSRRKVDLHDAATVWAEKYGQDYAWDIGIGAWRQWTGTHWELLPNAEALDLITVAVLHELGIAVMSMSKVDATVRLARDLCQRRFLPRQGLVNFQNGTLDTSTMRFRDHDRADGLLACLPYPYADKQSFGRIERFLEMTIPDPDGRTAYMAHLGAAMLADTSLHKALVLFGPTRSGKSSLLQLAQMVMGYHRGSAASGQIFSPTSQGANTRAVWADATPHLVCLDEFPEKALREDGEDIFKAMVAHGGVPIRHIYGKERAANTWTGKLLFATNNRLHYTDRSHALTERLVIVECPHTLPEEDRDPFLMNKLEPEIYAFAKACIDAALQVLATGRYPVSQAMRELLHDIEMNGDSAKLWLIEQCVIEPGGAATTQALYENYRTWCDENGVRPLSRPKLRDAMLSYSRQIVSTKRRVVDAETGESKPMWCLLGIRIRQLGDA